MRNYRYVVFRYAKGNAFREIIYSNLFCPSFDEFMKEVDDPVLSNRARVYPAPKNADVDAVLDALGDPRESDTTDVGTNVVASDPAFILSEFSRIIVMLRHKEHCRSAINTLQQELMRAQLDSGRTRESFWVTIADRFNESTKLVQYSFEGWVEDADPSLLPICFRAASDLKDQIGLSDPMQLLNMHALVLVLQSIKIDGSVRDKMIRKISETSYQRWIMYDTVLLLCRNGCLYF